MPTTEARQVLVFKIGEAMPLPTSPSLQRKQTYDTVTATAVCLKMH